MKKPRSKIKGASHVANDGLASKHTFKKVEIDAKGKVIDPNRDIISPEDSEDKIRSLQNRLRMQSEILKPYSPKGRTLRKAFERPRPDLPPDAPANRAKKQIALSLPRDLIEEVNDAAQARGVDRNTFIETAIRRMLQPR